MQQGIDRRQFLRGDIGNLNPTLRPPWSHLELDFLTHCDQCGDCLAACETGILERDGGGYPRVNFHNAGCSFCAVCVQACPTSALEQKTGSAPWALRASINTASCLASRGVLCLVCGEHCAAQAIRFPRAAYAITAPILNQAACTGCGACVAPCPGNAIRMVAE